ncbi:hypothetical protein OF83DRAFT_1100245 [Amylostereum chailletii]|nr:hypothetical protein OF83DRAFT_1100245 [Amylostereum chailletii]
MASFSDLDLAPSRAGDLARRLAALHSFVPATRELLSITHNLRHESSARRARKVIALVEIARSTLSRAGIKPHQFTACAPALLPFKSVYFDLLRALQERYDVIVETDLQDRAKRLLLPLSSWLVIERNAGVKEATITAGGSSLSGPASPASPSTSPFPSPSVNIRREKSNSTLASSPRRLSPAPVPSMPPPSTFPDRKKTSDIMRERSPQRVERLWGVEGYARTRTPRQCSTLPPEISDEKFKLDGAHVTAAAKQPARRFGIFCTGGKSGASNAGLGCRRTGRSGVAERPAVRYEPPLYYRCSVFFMGGTARLPQ